METEHPLKAYRKAKNWTQGKLASELDVTRTTVVRWENGQRKIDDELLPRVSQHTGISKQELRPDLVELLSAPKSEAAQ